MDKLGQVLIVGKGVSGTAVLEFCEAAGADLGMTSLTLVDGQDSVPAAVGGGGYDTVVVSPGIPPHAPLFQAARAATAPDGTFMGEAEFAWRISDPGVIWAAVTGTNGKTTVTEMLTVMLVASGLPAAGVGNIGDAATTAAAGAPAGTILVAELSSYQLYSIIDFHPRAAVLLNITPDHMAWHGDMQAYSCAKRRVFENMTDADFALDCTDGTTAKTGEWDVALPLPDADLPFAGDHNRANARAAAALARALGATEDGIAAALANFRLAPHRIADIATIDGVRYVDDSKATNPDATIKALTAFDPGTVHLLVGGLNKGLDFSYLARETLDQPAGIYCFGQAADELAGAYRAAGATEQQLSTYPTMAAALGAAHAAAQAAAGTTGQVVLLSPACASFDEFPQGYTQRGDAFIAQVTRYAESADAR
ncbi:MAG: UDP-N-acetylmuramoyl-L-alanine--D-glutamate ligase [Actinomycetes bacterium]|jgi:UDP-N-acetylmuramoylalanine--D-glutamate ligase|nr:UDP-N-acetylmuramoyl-L-alanine--D-glutamate ligase [Actinomycetes bacterium]